MHEICKSSAARGKAANRGTTSGLPSNKVSSKKTSTSSPSHSSTTITALSHSSMSNIPSLVSDSSATSAASWSSPIATSPTPLTGAQALSPPPPLLPNTVAAAATHPPDTARRSACAACPPLFTVVDESTAQAPSALPSVTAINTSIKPSIQEICKVYFYQ